MPDGASNANAGADPATAGAAASAATSDATAATSVAAGAAAGGAGVSAAAHTGATGTAADSAGAASGQRSAVADAAAADATKTVAWSENWRDEYSKGDAKVKARLDRYTSPVAVVDALLAAQNRISAGELKAPLPANPTPEQLTAYRAEHGIPEKPEAYLEKLPNGLVIGEADRPLYEDYVKDVLHKHNVSPTVAHETIAWLTKRQEQAAADAMEMDKKNAATTEQELRAEWGADFNSNQNLRKTLLDGAPSTVRDAFLNARLPDGTLLGQYADVSRWLASMQRQIDPMATIFPTGANPDQRLHEELASIEKTMRTNRNEYNRDERMQARYRDLLEAKSRLNSRAA